MSRSSIFGELDRRFDGGFDPDGKVAASRDDAAERLFRDCRASRAKPSAAARCKRLDEGVGEIKRVWVSGIGARAGRRRHR